MSAKIHFYLMIHPYKKINEKIKISILIINYYIYKNIKIQSIGFRLKYLKFKFTDLNDVKTSLT